MKTFTAMILTLAFAIVAAAQDPHARPPSVKPKVLTYYIADGAHASGYRDSDPQLAVWALQAWERAAAGALRLRPSEEDNAEIRIYWVDATEGLYGETRAIPLPNGTRGAAVFIHPDITALGSDIAKRAAGDPLFRESIVYLTCLHESGHALGLSHTRDFRDIMYFFGYGGDIVDYFTRYRMQLKTRQDIAAVSGLSAADASRVVQLTTAQ